jgi:hypothetical protein
MHAVQFWALCSKKTGSDDLGESRHMAGYHTCKKRYLFLMLVNVHITITLNHHGERRMHVLISLKKKEKRGVLQSGYYFLAKGIYDYSQRKVYNINKS